MTRRTPRRPFGAKIVIGRRRVKLRNLHPGLFLYEDTFAVKSEYCTQQSDGGLSFDSYIVSSGEYFWGGATSSKQGDLLVYPVSVREIVPKSGKKPTRR